MHTELEALQTELARILAEIEEKEKDIRSVKDKRERRGVILQQIESNTKLLEDVRSVVNSAKSYIADFPTDTQVLKLERRLESLKEQVKQLEHIEHQHIAGIEAYKQRRQQNREARATLVAGCEDLTASIAELAEAGLQEENGTIGTDGAREACDTLSTISSARELSLQEASKASDATADEAAGLSKVISELQQRSEREIPQVEAEKDKDIAEINEEWGKERDILQAVYDRLFVLNKEQSFHLQRGTHIKREVLVASESEKTLSSRHARLANEIIETTSKLQDATEDFAHIKKQAEQLRSIARAARAEYESIRQAKEAQLAKAREAVRQVEDEANSLRNLKGEIYQALQSVRDAPYVPITPRRR
jgi:chromosome segregation ATPase